jgi:hypothetical protein
MLKVSLAVPEFDITTKKSLWFLPVVQILLVRAQESKCFQVVEIPQENPFTHTNSYHTDIEL